MSNSVQSAAKSTKAEGREFLMSTFTHDPDALGSKVLSVALIGPQEQRRKAVASALAGSQASITREFTSYPEFDDVPRLLESDYDVIIVELDSDPEQALDLVEHICGTSSINRDGLFSADRLRTCWFAACGQARANSSRSPSRQHQSPRRWCEPRYGARRFKPAKRRWAAS